MKKIKTEGFLGLQKEAAVQSSLSPSILISGRSSCCHHQSRDQVLAYKSSF